MDNQLDNCSLWELPRPAWLEIDLNAIKYNLKGIRNLVGDDVSIMAIIKANAYGHGLKKMALHFLEYGANALGVATLSEGMFLRKSGIVAPILILGYVPPEHCKLAVKYGLTQTIYSYEMAKTISMVASTIGKKAKIHLKLDTGMGRLGFSYSENTVKTIVEITKLPCLEVEGIFSHFASADEKNKEYAHTQLKKFIEIKEALEKEGIVLPKYHIANSGAIIDMPEAYFSMVRPGIILYGYYPSNEVDKSRLDLKPAMSIKAVVAHVKWVKDGDSISYGCTYKAKGERLIATLPIGYADGYRRSESNKGEVLINGCRVPIVGAVCMDQMMVDVTNVPNVKVGDVATMVGKDGNEEITLEELADSCGTIHYEILTQLAERLHREYIL